METGGRTDGKMNGQNGQTDGMDGADCITFLTNAVDNSTRTCILSQGCDMRGVALLSHNDTVYTILL